ncbi:MAG: hypothetical protein INF12_14555 [Methylobacterium sp.]|nr:hypothetical protein [Methylobacterium sp.]
MKLPESVQIGHMRVAVVAMPERSGSRKDADGWFDYQRATIEVWDGLAPQVKAEILLHEILHAACIAGNTGLEGDTEERVVNGLAPVLLMLLRDNPDLFHELREALK